MRHRRDSRRTSTAPRPSTEAHSPVGGAVPERPRIGLGCMRMSTDDDRDERLAADTIAAAADAGITVFDTARAYGRDEAELGHNERLLATTLRNIGADSHARIVT